ncbi:MAG: type IV toxin-antitoxin system AbiEi family antitoxin [Candidatus Lutacidiplasmatales archaeon]
MADRSLSPLEARVVLSLESEGGEEISLAGIRGRARVSAGHARKLAHDLVRKRWLQRVGRGRYLLNPSRHGPQAIADTDPFRVGSRVATPYYFGYSTAAELLGLLPQASRVYFIVTTARGGVPPHAAEFRRVRIAQSGFFGTQEVYRRGTRLIISDPERTVLDCLARPEFCGGIGGAVRVLESAGRRIDWPRIVGYLERLGNRSLARRLGYLAETFTKGRAIPERWARRMIARAGEPYAPLGPATEFGRRGPHDSRWHLIRNVPEAVLRAEVDLR